MIARFTDSQSDSFYHSLFGRSRFRPLRENFSVLLAELRIGMQRHVIPQRHLMRGIDAIDVHSDRLLIKRRQARPVREV